jgi:hypothetical protein
MKNLPITNKELFKLSFDGNLIKTYSIINDNFIESFEYKHLFHYKRANIEKVYQHRIRIRNTDSFDVSLEGITLETIYYL